MFVGFLFLSPLRRVIEREIPQLQPENKEILDCSKESVTIVTIDNVLQMKIFRHQFLTLSVLYVYATSANIKEILCLPSD